MDLQTKARPMVMAAFKGHCQLKTTENVLYIFVASNPFIKFKNTEQRSFLNFPIVLWC